MPPDLRNGDWDYAWYQPDGTLAPGTNYEGCLTPAIRTGPAANFTFTLLEVSRRPKGRPNRT